MSKGRARNPQSYLNEEILLNLLPPLFEGKGFVTVVTRRHGQMKFVDAHRVDGTKITFWLKQGWTNTRDYSAVQFGLFEGPNPERLPDSHFTDYVDTRTARAKEQGATHALLVHMYDSIITNYVVLQIDDVARAYREQMVRWPRRARNTKTPTLYFEDSRNLPEAECVSVVTTMDIPLEVLASEGNIAEPCQEEAGSKKITAEIERRMRQQIFRVRVGDRYNWQCPVTGVVIREVLDAAHLPGRDWRFHNAAEDGVLLRVDLHRLLDRGLAEIRNDCFWVHTQARIGEYGSFHNRSVVPPLPNT